MGSGLRFSVRVYDLECGLRFKVSGYHVGGYRY